MSAPRVDYQTHPTQYKHWKLSFDGPVATLAADFDENAGLRGEPELLADYNRWIAMTGTENAETA